MIIDANENKGVFKVEAARGAAAEQSGPWVAMLTSDATGPEYFYGTKHECWEFIDFQRAAWKAQGKDLLQQAEQVVGRA